jgi:hypothetical protein
MRRRRSIAVLAGLLTATGAPGLAAPTAHAAWRLLSERSLPAVYNQGVAHDGVTGAYFFSGTPSTANSALVRTDSKLRRVAARGAVLPRTPQGFNHVGDLAFDPHQRRLLLALECYRPAAGGNTCGRGAIAVADPRALAVRYRVDLDPAQIAKAMWVETSPDGRWLWTSSGRRLLAYRAASISALTAARQRAGAAPLRGLDVGAVLPGSGVTGGAALPGRVPGTYRLVLSLNAGPRLQLVSYSIRPRAGAPSLASPLPSTEVSILRSQRQREPEGLAATPAGLVWQVKPSPGYVTRLLTYATL